MSPVRVGVLTVSDRCSRDEVKDESGPAIMASLPSPQFVVEYSAIIPDDRKTIAATLRRWVDEFDCDVVITTGGTGFSPRDVTPEATSSVIERNAENLANYLLIESVKVSPYAALSRGVAGIRAHSLIVNLPGSPKGAKELTEVLRPLLAHAVSVLRGTVTSHDAKPTN